MNYVLKNEQLFIESCRGPDYNRESGITVLFCSNSGGGDLVNVASRSGLIAAVAQFGGLCVGNVFTRVSGSGSLPAGVPNRMRTLTAILNVDANQRVVCVGP